VALAQAPINTFAGGIGLGFCPELDLTKPLCVQGALRREPDKSQQGFRLDPVADLVAPMAMLHGDMDQVCSHDAVAAFTGQVGNASMVSLPGVGHGFAVYQNWFPQMLAAYRQIDATPGPSQAAETVALNVPLIESRGSPTQGTLVVLLSGDGGWSSLTQKVTAELNRRGFPVLGWNTLKYFWNGKTPEQASADLGRVIDHYAKAWRIRDIVIGGYSMGADVLPGMVNRLGDNVRRDIRSVVLLAPGRTTDFTFHLTAWLQHTAADQPPILPDAQRLADQLALTCVYGREESDTSLCTQLEATKAIVRVLPGAHHFDGDYAGLADLIVSSMVPAN
jgi:type IV secretory pathway VirJ component